jgi:hypothetical protein
MEHKSFPSIEQFRNVIRFVKDQTQWVGKDETGEAKFDRTRPLPKIQYRGTVKLHGTNAGIVITNDNTWFQSRSNIITLDNDNAGFVRFMQDKVDTLKSIFDFDRLNEVQIFGEWCGKGIQKGVAISEVERMFVIFALKIDNEWKDMEEWKHTLSFPDLRIFTITSFDTFSTTIDFNKPEEIQNKLIELTNGVEEECPVGAKFGIAGKVGEGIVWTPIEPEYNSSKFWFKVKGSKHSSSKVKILAPVDTEKLENMKNFIEYAVTENRLQQGIEKLRERGLDPIDKNTGEFLRWVVGDVTKEEIDTIVESGLDLKQVNVAVSKAAREWYFKTIV